MKEITEILKAAYHWGRDNGEGRSDKNFNDFLNTFVVSKLEHLVNQEVEKRIAERMPSEMTLEEAEIAAKETDYACFAVEPEGNEINFADAAAFYLEGWNACRSRLVSQKTDNLKENNNNGSTN
jgi:hypothetical protein